ncbi:MAG: hypothetical protein IJM91_03270 [Lachnospiraceae bacterium]|nr:hypothetical protein [Lachnospiraceae bacterium]
MKKRLLAIVLTMAMALSGMMMPAKAKAESNFFVGATGLIDESVMFKGMSLEERAAMVGAVTYDAADQDFPAKFDLREYGLVTPVKDQNPYGTCWTFATCASLESNALVLGLGEFDLSEYHLGYTATHIPGTQDEMTAGEGFDADKSKGTKWYDVGGNIYGSQAALMKGMAVGPEEKYPYSDIKKKLPDEAFGDCAIHTDACVFITATNTNAIKSYIVQNGAMQISVDGAFEGKAFNPDTNAAYVPEWGKGNGDGTNHAVTVVGWDDNYSKDNFLLTPEGDGAWIIKNSWSEEWGEAGYYYLSYYDAAIDDDHTWCGYKAAPVDNYDFQYQYDGSWGIWGISDATDVAMTFNVKRDQTMTGVKVSISEIPDGAVNAVVKVYRGVDSIDNLNDSKVIYTQKAVVNTGWYSTIEFNKGVNINADEKIFVTVSFDKPVYYMCDGPDDFGDGRKVVAFAKEGETFLISARDPGKWYDHGVDGGDIDEDPANNVCLKAMVRDGHNQPVIHRNANAVNLEEPTFYLLNNEEAKVTVTWKEVENAEGYNIYRKVKGVENEFTLLAKVEAGTTKYADKNLTIGQDYIYKVVPFAGSVEGTSAEKTIRATIAAPWLTKLANNKKGQVTVSIKAVKGAKSYSVYRLIGKTYQYLGNTTKTTYVDAFKKGKYEKGVTYTYKLAVKVGDRTSALSAAKSITVTK